MKSISIILFVLIISNVTEAQWVPQYSGTTNHLRSVYFTDANLGYAVGNYGTILKTTDGGENWISQNSGTTNTLSSVFFIDHSIGFAVGYYDGTKTLLKTINGGEEWMVDTIHGGSSVFFPDANTGYIMGSGFFKTTDGGANWTYYNSPSVSAAYFVNADTGYAITDYTANSIYKTEDGGNNWTEQLTGITSEGGLNSIFFTNADTGFAVGVVMYLKILLKTTDGGANWTTQYGTPTNNIYFFDSNIGYIAGDNGAISKTEDGGNSWLDSYTGTNNNLYSVHFPTIDTGYTVGWDGIILKTTNGGIVGFSDNNITADIIKIYPNPASDELTINYQLKKSAVVNINLIDLQGKQHMVLSKEANAIGIQTESLNVSHLPPGVYFLRLQVGNEMVTKKIVKVR